MAFLDSIDSNKQHINLSQSAFDIIQNDMFSFGEDKLSTFVNRVFENYHPQAEASIGRTLNTFKGELKMLFQDIPCNEDIKNQLIQRLIFQKKASLVQKTKTYDKGVSFKFWLNKDNFSYLTEDLSECTEEKHYPRGRGQYIKCVLEEYARLPYVEREYIYYLPFIKSINDAIERKKQLRLKTVDSVYSIYPYKILRDPLSTANYLVGYSKRYNNEEDELRPCSFRISALRSVKVESSKSAFLNSRMQNDLLRMISARGVQFMSGREQEIVVKLSSEGLRKFSRQSHLRPTTIEKISDDTFVFNCTVAQAQFYFFKFGEDAEIISPAFLREKFLAMYNAAAENYSMIEE